MRDPRGRISISADLVVRDLVDALPAEDFLRLPLARELVHEGLLVDFELRSESQVVAPRIAWVSQPSEWCRAQLLDAARLTLDIAERVLPVGYELKDASAWNVIFDGCTPRFCDHLSFEKISRPEWHAFGQFARHFILPLVVAIRSGLPVHAQFRLYRDGVTPQIARKLCGWRIYLSRAAPLMLGSKASKRLEGPASPPREGRPLHAGLLGYCRSSLPSRPAIDLRQAKASRSGSWSEYTRERDHYSPAAVTRKTELVSAWIQRASPRWVLDLGANTGEFTLLAAQHGARVIAVDSDHECIERLYLGASSSPNYATAIHPVVAQLDDLCGGRGWRGREAPGLVARLAGQCDIVMMLGLLHHLMLACAIPVGEIAAFAAELTRDTLIVETISERDPKFRQLAGQYGRTGDAERLCGQEAQIAAFERRFEVIERVHLPDTERTLLLLSRRAA